MYQCNWCIKLYHHRQSLWKHNQSCRRYGPPNSYNSNDDTVGEKRKVVEKYGLLSGKRSPSLSMLPLVKKQHTKGDIVGYSDDETPKKIETD